jgi:hypothetical protein
MSREFPLTSSLSPPGRGEGEEVSCRRNKYVFISDRLHRFGFLSEKIGVIFL